jgi:hypothetical protein
MVTCGIEYVELFTSTHPNPPPRDMKRSLSADDAVRGGKNRPHCTRVVSLHPHVPCTTFADNDEWQCELISQIDTIYTVYTVRQTIVEI